MCRLLGLIANKQVDLRFSLIEGPTTLTSLSKRNPDGWGLGWYKNGQPAVVKEPAPADSSQRYQATSAEAMSDIFIAHVRTATTGGRRKENCHPFQYDPWLFAHNGSVNRKAVYEWLNGTHRSSIRGDTDSEVYFHWIVQSIEKASSAEEGITSALERLKGQVTEYTGLNFVLSDGHCLYAYRDASGNHDYYSLFYLVRQPGRQHPEEFRSKEVSAMLETKSLRGEQAVLVCSEKLTEEPWKEISIGQLLVVDPQLNTRCLTM